ncbi:ABC transporter substrate-binding protein [Psychromicrobium xiongbiense]|uniref:ABC transporter substrate-binding protein n=1 Tax=Psychromicrobium xiongbiense TaxID=3051184 RepID=UPI002557980C|nr:ABC transporter substrate-binding protein [Psychromicrobium sp. YIM S02556]
MKRSPRSLAIAGACFALAALALAGCSSGPITPAASASGDVALVHPGSLTVCTHLPYAPFQSNNDKGETVGFDVDLMDLVAKKLGVKQAIVDTPFEGIKSGQDLSARKCDIAAAGMTITDARKQVITFSAPYFDATQALLVAPGSTLNSLADLKGKKLGAQSATTGLDYAKAHASDCGCTIVEYQDLASETQALTSGQIDAAINDLPVWTEAIKENPGKAKVSAQFNTGEQYGFGMQLGNTALKKVVDDVIAGAKADGAYDTLYKKWIGDVPKS